MGLQTMFLGDSVGYGSLGPGRLSVTPRQNVNAAQTVFDVSASLDYTKGGASMAGVLSLDSTIREAHGLPDGASLDILLAFSGCEAVLICLGGNDPIPGFEGKILELAGKCITAGKPFAFVGLVEIDAVAAYNYGVTNGFFAPGASFYTATFGGIGLLEHLGNLAWKAETLKQVCRKEGYPFLDVRAWVDAPLGNTTGDFVHPTQEYSTAIFNKVGRSIAGLP
jgi:hypothetical protein